VHQTVSRWVGRSQHRPAEPNRRLNVGQPVWQVGDQPREASDWFNHLRAHLLCPKRRAALNPAGGVTNLHNTEHYRGCWWVAGAMHTALRAELVLAQCPLKVASLAAWGDKCVVGTQCGALLVLGEVPSPPPNQHVLRFEVRSHRLHSPKVATTQPVRCSQPSSWWRYATAPLSNHSRAHGWLRAGRGVGKRRR
jgi:hypothetical protein